MKINGFDPQIYGAELLDYTIDGCELENTYLLAPSSISPLRLNGKTKLRQITLTFDFEAYDMRETTLNMSNFTAKILRESELEMPDGFLYTAILTGTGSSEQKSDWIAGVTYTFIGFRHGPLEQHRLTQSGNIFVAGNSDTECRFIIETSADSITINGITITNINSTIVIDGIKKVAQEDGLNKFLDCNMTTFPVLTPGLNQIEFNQPATVFVEYYPIYL